MHARTHARACARTHPAHPPPPGPTPPRRQCIRLKAKIVSPFVVLFFWHFPFFSTIHSQQVVKDKKCDVTPPLFDIAIAWFSERSYDIEPLSLASEWEVTNCQREQERQLNEENFWREARQPPCRLETSIRARAVASSPSYLSLVVVHFRSQSQLSTAKREDTMVSWG